MIPAVTYVLRLFVAELLALALIAGVILLLSTAWQSVWPAESGQGCEAATMILLADRERVRREYERLCLGASGTPDNFFARIECEATR